MKPKLAPHCTGHTLTELVVAMGISSVVMVSVGAGFRHISGSISQEVVVGEQQDGLRSAIHQIARDIRLAGANPTGLSTLFDANPPEDVPLVLDPDLDGDVNNGFLVRADKSGSAAGSPDGDADDTLETVMYHHDKDHAKLMRHVWRIAPDESGTETQDHARYLSRYDAEPFLDNICTFAVTWYDKDEVETRNSDDVASLAISVSAAVSPNSCFERHSFTRSFDVRIRIRNR